MASAVEKDRFDNSSNDEKIVNGTLGREQIDPDSDIADPDAGLSEEERAAAVRAYSIGPQVFMLINSVGSQAVMETRLEAYPVAFFPLPHLLLGQDQHW
jgi:hypothetical protein